MPSAVAPLCMTTKAADKSASRRPLQLCLFDARRGDREGEEHDKLLGYFPADVPTIEQCRTVGLVQASQTFLKTFDGVGALNILCLLKWSCKARGEYCCTVTVMRPCRRVRVIACNSHQVSGC